MNEFRQFLRFLVPGFLFVTQSVALVLIVFPNWVSPLQLELSGADAAFALLASSTIGYVCATIHHSITWWVPSERRVIGYDEAFARLVEQKLISQPTGPAQSHGIDSMLLLWHSRTESSHRIKAAASRVNSLADIAHSAGAARVAASLAIVPVLWIGLFDGRLDFSAASVTRTLAAVVLAGLVVTLFQETWRRTGGLVGRLMGNALEEELKAPRASSSEPLV